MEALIAGYVSKRPKSRNAQLARLDLVARMMAGKHSTTASLLATCKAYFDNNKTKLYCFHDLREYLPALDDSLRGEFYSHVCQNVNMNVAEAEVCVNCVRQV